MSTAVIEQPGLAPARAVGHPRRWLALALILVAAFMDLIDGTIVNVAIPSIQRDLGATYGDVEWVAAAYALAFAVALITGGRLGDIYGRRRVVAAAMAIFIAASAVCGAAPSPAALISARFVQGVAAALMVPQVLAMIQALFPPRERRGAYGLYGAVLGVAGVSGPVLGGLLLHWNPLALEWRSIFLINVPIGICALIGILLFVPETRAEERPSLDLVGVILASTALALLVFPLVQRRALGWPTWCFALLALSTVAFALLGRYEHRRALANASPLVDPRLFRRPAFIAGLLVTVVAFAGLGAFFFVFTLHLQIGLGFSALRTGLTAAGFPIGVALASAASAQLAPRVGRAMLVGGFVLMALAMLVLALVVDHAGVDLASWHLLVPLFIYGLGTGAVAPTLVDFVLAGVADGEAGTASGVVNTGFQLGTALGIAVVGVLFFGLLGSNAMKSVDAVQDAVSTRLAAAGVAAPARAHIIAGFRSCAHARAAASDPTAVPAVCKGAGASRQLSTVLAGAGADVRKQDFTASFERIIWYELALFLGALPLVFLLPRKPVRHDAVIMPAAEQAAAVEGAEL